MKLTRALITCLLLSLVWTAQAQTVPFISGFTPASGYSCEVVSINGYNFDNGLHVFFGAVEGNVISVNDQLIEVEVPSGATFDHLTVINPNGRMGYSREKFLPSFGGAPGISAADFANQVDLSLNSGLFDLCLCDLNNDGKSDIITTNTGTNRVDILANNSTAASLSFSRQEVSLPSNTLNVSCGDLNGDAKPDLVFTEGDDGSKIFILQNNSGGSLSFSLIEYNISGSATKRVAIRDLDLDGRPELVVTDQSLPNVYILKNTSSGAISFAPAFTTLNVAGANSTSGIAVDDFDGDRRPDILVTQFLNGNGGFFVARNTGTTNNIAFSSFEKFTAPGALFNVISAKINNDNRPDVVGSQFTENMMSLFGNTSATPDFSFTNPSYRPTNLRPWGIDGGDLDGDGLVDFALSTTGTDLAVSVMRSQGSGVFTNVPIKATYINRNVRIGDINGDGKPDIVVTSVDDAVNAIPASRISIFQNQKCYQPEITPTGPLTYCSGYTEFLSVPCIAGATYDWKVDGVTVQNGSSNEIEATTTGAYTVTVNQGSCSTTSAPVDVTVKSATSLPAANITANSPVCAGQTLNLSSNDVGATNYVWTGPNGYSANGRNVSIADFRIADAGRYTLDIYSGDCLLQSESILVEVTPAPNFTIVSGSGGTEFCQGQSATLTIQPVVSGFDYQWFNESGAISGATGNSYNATQSGNYYVEVTDQVSGCPKIQTNELSISFVNQPTAAFEAPSGVCAGSPVQFNNASIVTGDANYLWDFGDGSSSTEASPLHTFDNKQSYTITLTVNYGDASCQDITSQSITVADGLQVEMNIGDVTVCEGETVQLSPLGTYAEYTWQDGSNDPVYNVTESGTYTVIVRDAGGCEGTVSSTITFNGTPDVEVTASPSAIPPGETVTLSVTGLMSYSWEPAALVSDPNVASPTAVLDATTTFTVTGMTDTGCQASGEVTVRVDGELIGENLHPKNFFSPNDGDMINATWEIEGIDNYPECAVEIYDQTGNRIYEAKPYLNEWDGTSGGQMVPDGAYYYVIKCNGGEIVKSGSVTLLRN